MTTNRWKGKKKKGLTANISVTSLDYYKHYLIGVLVYAFINMLAAYECCRYFLFYCLTQNNASYLINLCLYNVYSNTL